METCAECARCRSSSLAPEFGKGCVPAQAPFAARIAKNTFFAALCQSVVRGLFPLNLPDMRGACGVRFCRHAHVDMPETAEYIKKLQTHSREAQRHPERPGLCASGAFGEHPRHGVRRMEFPFAPRKSRRSCHGAVPRGVEVHAYDRAPHKRNGDQERTAPARLLFHTRHHGHDHHVR